MPVPPSHRNPPPHKHPHLCRRCDSSAQPTYPPSPPAAFWSEDAPQSRKGYHQGTLPRPVAAASARVIRAAATTATATTVSVRIDGGVLLFRLLLYHCCRRGRNANLHVLLLVVGGGVGIGVGVVEAVDCRDFAEVLDFLELVDVVAIIELAGLVGTVEVAHFVAIVDIARLVEFIGDVHAVEVVEAVEIVDCVEFAAVVELVQAVDFVGVEAVEVLLVGRGEVVALTAFLEIWEAG